MVMKILELAALSALLVMSSVACEPTVDPCQAAYEHLVECFHPKPSEDSENGLITGECSESRLCGAECVNAASCDDMGTAQLVVMTIGAQEFLACLDACSH
jgi:hypothetical protein